MTECYCDDYGPCWPCQDRDMRAENAALRAAVRRVEAELARREKCAADERAAGRVCDYCEDFIPEVRAALEKGEADGDL